MSTPEIEATADRLHSAAIHLLRHVRKEDAASGISGAQLSVLSVLVFAGPQTLGALAKADQVTPPTMSQLVSALERRGLVRRRARDRRSILVSATPEGRKLLQAGRRRRLKRLAKALGVLPPEKLALLHEAADLVLNAAASAEAEA